ncbi:hypothetical protein [Streptomyces sp. NBC_00057]|uniref:hypothetical protein n=1 Tax=Streptomyces sp. NBC_00057 TaxID=2975634 RepID=UPI00324D6FE8
MNESSIVWRRRPFRRACRRPASGPDTPPAQAPMTGHVTTPVAERDVHGLVAELRGMLKSP